MFQLNLPSYNFNIKKQDEKLLIFDAFRRKFVSLTPEEWVRQNFLRFLTEQKHFPAPLVAVEKLLMINGTRKRFDAVVYNRRAEPVMILEFKAPNIPLSQDVFDQAAVYNYILKAKYLAVSNGMEHYCCEVKTDGKGYDFLSEIPDLEKIAIC